MIDLLAFGDLLILPIGWCGDWVVHEDMRKTYDLLSTC